jgi:hypothetical protein
MLDKKKVKNDKKVINTKHKGMIVIAGFNDKETAKNHYMN